jgi:hypothetical protein
MTTEAKSAEGTAAAADASVPSNTRTLGVEASSYTPPGLSSVELPLPGKEPAPKEAPVEAAVEEKPVVTETKTEEVDPAVEEKKEGEEAPADEGEEGDKEAPAALNLEAYQTEWQKDGKLSDKSVEEITAKTGLDAGTIASIAAAMQAQQDANMVRINAPFGAPENKEPVLEWARDNWSDAQKEAYTAALDSNDVSKIELAVKGLVSDYKAAGGTFAATTTVDTSVANLGGEGSADGYKSQADYRADLRSPKYKKDPVFRASVQAKLKVSEFYKQSRG